MLHAAVGQVGAPLASPCHRAPDDPREADEERGLHEDHHVRPAHPLRPTNGREIAAIDHPGVTGDSFSLPSLERGLRHGLPPRVPGQPVQVDDRQPEDVAKSQRNSGLARAGPSDDRDAPGWSVPNQHLDNLRCLMHNYIVHLST